MSIIAMSRKRAILVALVSAIVLTAMGHLLAFLGGWGPARPAGTVGGIGATLLAWPLLRVALRVVPGLESRLAGVDSSFVKTAALSVLPVLLWTTVILLALLAGSRLRRRLENRRPPSDM